MSSHDRQGTRDTSRDTVLQVSEIVDWTDARLDEAFRRAQTIPLGDRWVNAGEHKVDVKRHELYNDENWKGFVPIDLPIRDVFARLSTGYAKRFWAERGKVLGETLYVNGAILVKHALEDITIDRPVNDLDPGRYVLLRYTDPVFEHVFYDVMKLVSPDLILYRGYTGRFPDGRRGLTAPLIRRYTFAQMGTKDHTRLFGGGSTPVEKDMIGTWRLDAIATSNQPTAVARLQFDRTTEGRLRSVCDTEATRHNLLLPAFVSEHFEGDAFSALRKELRKVDRGCMVGRWTTPIRGPYAKMLLAGSPGLFHVEKSRTGRRQFSLYYVLTRVS
jgi:hypothetical protein